MKKITRITIFLVFLITTFLFINFYKYYDDISIPVKKEGFIIYSWDKKLNKRETNELLSDLAKKYGARIIRVNDSYEDDGKTKFIVNYSDDKEKFDYRPFSKGKKYKQLSIDDEKLNRLKFDDSFFYMEEKLPGGFYKELEKNGITTAYFNQFFYSVLLNFFSLFNLIPSIIILLLILFTAIIYEQLSSVRDSSIKRLHGFNTIKIFLIQAKRLLIEFIRILAIINLLLLVSLYLYNRLAQYGHVILLFHIYALSYLIVLLLMLFASFIVVNKETYKIRKYIKNASINGSFQYMSIIIKVVVTLTLLNVISSSIAQYRELKENLNSEYYWSKNNDLYMTEIANNETDSDEEKFEVVDKAILTLIQNIPDDYWLLSSHSQYDWKREGENYSIDNAIFVNKTFLNRNTIKVKDDKNIDFSKVTILLPERAYNKKESKTIKEEMKELIQFYDEIKKVPNKEKFLDIDVLETDNHFKLFNYSSKSELNKSISYNPVIIVMPKDLNLISFYAAAASKGQVLFKDYDYIDSKIRGHNLEDEIQGLTNIHSNVLQEILQIKMNLAISIVTSVFGYVVLLGVYLFSIGVYCDAERNKIFVKTIHGYAFLKKHIQFIIMSILATVIALAMISYFKILNVSMYSSLLIVIIEVIAIMIILQRYEDNLLKEVRKGETE